LDFFHNISEGRITGYELLAGAVRSDDRKVAASAWRQLERVDNLIKDRRAGKSDATD
jgi:hypothetical protein